MGFSFLFSVGNLTQKLSFKPLAGDPTRPAQFPEVDGRETALKKSPLPQPPTSRQHLISLPFPKSQGKTTNRNPTTRSLGKASDKSLRGETAMADLASFFVASASVKQQGDVRGLVSV